MQVVAGLPTELRQSLGANAEKAIDLEAAVNKVVRALKRISTARDRGTMSKRRDYRARAMQPITNGMQSRVVKKAFPSDEPEQLGEAYVERLGELCQVLQGRVSECPLDAAEVRPMHRRFFGKPLLRPSFLRSKVTNPSGELSFN